MSPEDRALLQTIGHFFLVRNFFTIFGVTCLCYGILAPLCAAIVYSLIKSEHASYLSRVMLGVSIMSWIAFGISMGLQIASVFHIFDIFKISNLSLDDRVAVVNAWNFKLDLGADWLAYCIPLLNDVIITWRAWILGGKQRWVLYISIMLWIGSLGTTLGWLILDTARPNIVSVGPNIYNDLLSISLFLSFGTNMVATSYIGYRLWLHQRTVRAIGRVRHIFTVWHTLLLLVESGVIYGILQFLIAVMNVAPLYTDSALIVFYVMQSILTSFSMAYPTLTAGIIRGPFSLARAQESVVEFQFNGAESRDMDTTMQSM